MTYFATEIEWATWILVRQNSFISGKISDIKTRWISFTGTIYTTVKSGLIGPMEAQVHRQLQDKVGIMSGSEKGALVPAFAYREGSFRNLQLHGFGECIIDIEFDAIITRRPAVVGPR